MEVVTGQVDWSRNSRGPKYPWETILDGQTWRLEQGEDFSCKPESFRGAVYLASKARGKKSRCKVEGTAVYVEALDG